MGNPMTTVDAAAPPPRARESWADWAEANERPYSPVLTRAELLGRLARMGFDVSAPALRAWERDGLLPQPTKQWHEGATRAVYPGQAVASILLFLGLKREGYRLRQIGERVRASLHPHRVPDRFGLHGPLARVARGIERAEGLTEGTWAFASVRFVAPNGHDQEELHFVLVPDDAAQDGPLGRRGATPTPGATRNRTNARPPPSVRRHTELSLARCNTPRYTCATGRHTGRDTPPSRRAQAETEGRPQLVPGTVRRSRRPWGRDHRRRDRGGGGLPFFVGAEVTKWRTTSSRWRRCRA